MLKEINKKYITIDVDRGTKESFSFYKGETSASCVITVMRRNNLFDLNKLTCKCYLEKPDKNSCFIDVEVKDTNGKLYFELSQNILAAAGVINCTLILYEGKTINKILPNFVINCKDNYYNDTAIVSTPEFSALQNALIDAQNVVNKGNYSKNEIEKLVEDYINQNVYTKKEIQAFKYITKADVPSFSGSSHSHSNLSTLNNVTDEVIANSHNHGNLSVLNKITQDTVDYANNCNSIIEITSINGELIIPNKRNIKANVSDGDILTLPNVNEFTEIHVFIFPTSALILDLPSCKWNNIPNIEENKCYELIFTYVGEWLGGVVCYE